MLEGSKKHCMDVYLIQRPQCAINNKMSLVSRGRYPTAIGY